MGSTRPQCVKKRAQEDSMRGPLTSSRFLEFYNFLSFIDFAPNRPGIPKPIHTLPLEDLFPAYLHAGSYAHHPRYRIRIPPDGIEKRPLRKKRVPCEMNGPQRVLREARNTGWSSPRGPCGSSLRYRRSTRDPACGDAQPRTDMPLVARAPCAWPGSIR